MCGMLKAVAGILSLERKEEARDVHAFHIYMPELAAIAALFILREGYAMEYPTSSSMQDAFTVRFPETSTR